MHPTEPAAHDTDALARAAPKVLLHEHLDGGLRVGTLFELLHARGLEPPAPDVPALAAWFDANAHAGSLEKYLAGFTLTVAAMADLDAMERVAYEAAEDALADGCVLAEFRIAPTLFEAHGIAAESAVEAMLSGLRRSRLPCGLILCGMRERAPADAERTVAIAVRHRAGGVVGFDLAGPERGYPVGLHEAALRQARDAGLPLTLHAGEADAAERVIEAAEHGARRIGHGVRLADAFARADGARLLDDVRRRGLHLEVCPTSNVHTGAYASLAAHPIAALWRAGIGLSYHTDNRLMSMLTHGDEAAGLVRECGLDVADLLRMAVAAARASFMPEGERALAEAAVRAWAAAHGIDI